MAKGTAQSELRVVYVTLTHNSHVDSGILIAKIGLNWCLRFQPIALKRWPPRPIRNPTQKCIKISFRGSSGGLGMESFAPGVLYNCKFCNFMASDQWHCDIHRKLTHEKLITDKTKVNLLSACPSSDASAGGLNDSESDLPWCLFKMLISTLLNTIVHPNSTPNIQIIINNKNEFLNGVEKSPTKKLLPRIEWFSFCSHSTPTHHHNLRNFSLRDLWVHSKQDQIRWRRGPKDW